MAIEGDGDIVRSGRQKRVADQRHASIWTSAENSTPTAIYRWTFHPVASRYNELSIPVSFTRLQSVLS